MRTIKSSVTLFDGAFPSNSNGALRMYLVPDQVRKLVGQASRLRISVVGTQRTANAQLTLKLYDTADASKRPSELAVGYAPSFTSAAITSLTPQPIDVAGPFCDNVDIVLEVQASTGTADEEWRGTISATLFLD